jgi:hypothetical protein
VLKETKTDTAPGPDGFPVVFFKSFWSILKPLILQILNGFALGLIDILRLNFGILFLIRKVPGADDIKQFRPIALINVIFKLISKAYAIRLSPVAHRIISSSQTAFIKGRHIHDGALALYEIVHELHVKKTRVVILKLDFEKAYDRVSLVYKGFESSVVHRLMQLVTGVQTAISINGEIGPYFRNKRGVRQGDPISPLLFDFLADALAIILDHASVAGHIKGVVSHLVLEGVTHLQYANDTILLIKLDDAAIANLKFILICFEILYGLKINFFKSEVIMTGVSPYEQYRVARMFKCKEGGFPMTYMGFPIVDRKHSIAMNYLVETVGHRVDP